MISVLTFCYTRQEILNQTLPGWLNQEGIDYEVVLAHSPNITFKPHKRLVPVEYIGGWNICKMCNLALSKAKGDIIVITPCDMLLKTNSQIKRMLDVFKPDRMVKERAFTLLHLCMVSKEALIKAGGWHDLFGDYYGYEDTDLVATLMENGIKDYYIDTPGAVVHLTIPREITDDIRERYAKSKALFEARHG